MTKIQTIRESIDTYRQRLVEGLVEDSSSTCRLYPKDNENFALKASSEDIRKMLEDSGQFRFKLERTEPPRILYSMDCLPTNTLIIIERVDKGGIEGSYFCKSSRLGGDWTPMSLHPESYAPEIYIDAINTLEILLSIAEKHRVPMVTEHKDGWEKFLVRYTRIKTPAEGDKPLHSEEGMKK